LAGYGVQRDDGTASRPAGPPLSAAHPHRVRERSTLAATAPPVSYHIPYGVSERLIERQPDPRHGSRTASVRQSADNPVLRRRLELLGDAEYLRVLRE